MVLKQRYGVDQINIVAHSKGGLDSRAYISTNWMNDKNDVATLITIASPHHGSRLASLCKSVYEFFTRSTEAVQNLTENYIDNTFNPNYPGIYGVRYYSIAADAGKICRIGRKTWNCAVNWQQEAYPNRSRIALGLAYQVLNGGDSKYRGTNDFAVTVLSTNLIDNVPGHTNANTTQYVYARNHHSIRAALKNKKQKDMAIVKLIADLLDVNANTTIYSISQFSSQEMIPSPADKGTGLGLESGTITAGQMFLYPVGVDTLTQVSFLLSWDVGELYINLIDPTGRVIIPTTEDANITYSEDRTNNSSGQLFLSGKVAGYDIVSPVVGLWQVQIIAASQLPGDQANWMLITTHDSHVSISVNPETPWEPLNSIVQITSIVEADGIPITNAVVKSSVIHPDGTVQDIMLHDDGVHGDGAVNDGVYGNSFVGTQFGIYGLSAKATGTWDGIPFSRIAVSEVQIASGTASISGTYNDQGIDLSSDGLYDILQVEVPIVVISGARFMVFGELRSANGALLATANAAGDLATGQQTLILYFKGEEIWANAGNGRFKLSNLTLLDMNTTGLPVKIDYAEMAYTTKSYSREEFQRPDVFLTGVTEDYGVDFDGNGKFDELVVEVEADLRADGNYEWRGTLVGADGYEFGIHSSSDNFLRA
jgi:hypothetical protein